MSTRPASHQLMRDRSYNGRIIKQLFVLSRAHPDDPRKSGTLIHVRPHRIASKKVKMQNKCSQKPVLSRMTQQDRPAVALQAVLNHSKISSIRYPDCLHELHMSIWL